MVRCATPTVFLRLVALASAVAVIHSEGGQHKDHSLDLSPSQQLATATASSFVGEVLQHESDEKTGGSVRRTGLLAAVEGASGGTDRVSLPTAREPRDGDYGSRTEGSASPQLAEDVRRPRRAAESKAPTPAPAASSTGPFSGLAPTTSSATTTKILAPSLAARQTFAPIAVSTTTTSSADAPTETTPTPVSETPAPTTVPATPPSTTNPTPVRASPAPTVAPATPQPATMEPTPTPESPPPTALPTQTLAPITPTTTATSRPETPAPSSAEIPATPPPAIAPTTAADVEPSPAPQTPEEGGGGGEEEISPTPPPGSTPTPTAQPLPNTSSSNDPGDDGGAGAPHTDDTSSSGGNDDSGSSDGADNSTEPGVDGQATVGGGGGGGGEGAFVIGTGLDSDEKQKIVIGASVIGSVAVALIVAAVVAKRYNASLAELDEDDDEEGGLAKGRPGRLQARQPLPRMRGGGPSGSRTIEM